MLYDINLAKKIAKKLLQINAIILQPNNPFKWASGWKSPIYCDNRKTLSFPELRNEIKKGLSKIVIDHYKDTNLIAGVATAGIPHGVLVAEELSLPFIYVRAKAKQHGKKNQIEGFFKRGQNAILVEDLISSGQSSIEAASSLRNEGVNVNGIISIFTYNFDIASNNIKNKNYLYHSLCDYNILLEQATEQKYIKHEDLTILKKWRENPSSWKK